MKAINALPVVLDAIENDQPIMITGDRGVGKTTMVHDIVKLLDADMVVTHLGLLEPSEMGGLPWVEAGRAKRILYDDIRSLTEQRDKLVVWFWDDLGLAHKLTQGAAMQWINPASRGYNGHTLSPNVRIVAATNDVGDKGTAVTGFITPMKDRFPLVVRLEPDIKSCSLWWLQHDVNPRDVACLNWNESILHEPDPFQDMRRTPSIRAWTFIFRNIDRWRAKFTDDVVHENVKNTVGEAAATVYMAFLRMYDKLPDLGKIEKNPNAVAMPTDNQTRYAIAAALANRCNNPATIDNLMTFAGKLPPEFQTIFFTCASQRHGQIVVDHAAYTTWAIANGNLLMGTK